MSAPAGNDGNGRVHDGEGNPAPGDSAGNSLVQALPAPRLHDAAHVHFVANPANERVYREMLAMLHEHYVQRVDLVEYERASRELYRVSKGVIELATRMLVRQALPHIIGTRGAGKSLSAKTRNRR